MALHDIEDKQEHSRDDFVDEKLNNGPQAVVPYDEKALKRALFKLDLLFLPACTLVYFLNFLDRSNIGNAKAAGLMQDLKLSSHQYSIALTVTYVPYIVAELPLTLSIKKVGPRNLIPILMVAWGLVTTLQGLVHNYAGLLACRFFLGATEGAILPACMTYMSWYYRRGDMAKRVAFFFAATSLAGAFSGLLAAAIVNMHGVGGKPGWAWIFILEGILTIICGALVYIVLPKSPSTVWYLKPEERTALIAALDADRPPAEEHEPLTVKVVLSTFTRPQMWFMFVQLFASGTCLFAMAYFTPTIVGAAGYKGVKVQLYSVPPYVVSTFVAFSSCYLSDTLKLRGPFVMIAAMINAIGYAMYLAVGGKNSKVMYASLFLQVMGSYMSAPLLSTWMPNNIAPFYRRVTAICLGFVSTNSGGILSTWLFPAKEAPAFKRGTSVLLAMSVLMAVFAAVNMVYLSAVNGKRARQRQAEGIEGGVETDGAKGDRSVYYKYIL